MSKPRLTVFLCQSDDCRKAWRRLCHAPPRKWLKRQIEAAGLPYKLRVVETACQDRCDEAACLCAVCGPCAASVTRIRCEDDADRLLAAMRACVERTEAGDGRGQGVGHAPPGRG
jgi:hypothetical protein